MALVTSYCSRLILCFHRFLKSPGIAFPFMALYVQRRMVLVARKGLHDSIAFYLGAKQWRIRCNRCIGLGAFMFTVLWMEKSFRIWRPGMLYVITASEDSNPSDVTSDLPYLNPSLLRMIIPFLTTLDRFGLGISRNSSTFKTLVIIEWLRIMQSN